MRQRRRQAPSQINPRLTFRSHRRLAQTPRRRHQTLRQRLLSQKRSIQARTDTQAYPPSKRLHSTRLRKRKSWPTRQIQLPLKRQPPSRRWRRRLATHAWLLARPQPKMLRPQPLPQARRPQTRQPPPHQCRRHRLLRRQPNNQMGARQSCSPQPRSQHLPEQLPRRKPPPRQSRRPHDRRGPTRRPRGSVQRKPTRRSPPPRLPGIQARSSPRNQRHIQRH